MIQEKAMIGYITDGGKVSAIEPSWNLGDPDHLGKFLIENYPTKEDAIHLIDKGGIGVCLILKRTIIGMWMDLVMLSVLNFHSTKKNTDHTLNTYICG